ncbi:MAG: DUF1572 family protein [Planctomycetota bacterium]
MNDERGHVLSGLDDFRSVAVAAFFRQRMFAEHCLNQLSDTAFFARPMPHINSCAVIVQHLAGNMLSRWSEFEAMLNHEIDAEKPNRDRETEFEDPPPTAQSREQLMERWDVGWRTTHSAIQGCDVADLDRTILIRGAPHTVTAAIVRQIDHYGYHVGQIAMIARMMHAQDQEHIDWDWFTIPPDPAR